MKKEDFTKGQKVYLYLVGNSVRYAKTKEDRIVEAEVISVGRKYITVRRMHYDIRFDINNNFRHVYEYGGADYILFLTKQDIYAMLERKEKLTYIKNFFRTENSGMHDKLSRDELNTIVDILSQYLPY